MELNYHFGIPCHYGMPWNSKMMKIDLFLEIRMDDFGLFVHSAVRYKNRPWLRDWFFCAALDFLFCQHTIVQLSFITW